MCLIGTIERHSDEEETTDRSVRIPNNVERAKQVMLRSTFDLLVYHQISFNIWFFFRENLPKNMHVYEENFEQLKICRSLTCNFKGET